MNKPMLKLILLGAAIVAAIVIAVIYSHGQSSMSLSPGDLLSKCVKPATGSRVLVFCNVANDPANPDGLYVSANGAPFFLVANAVAPPPAALTKISCPTASFVSGATGKFDASGCTIN